MTGLKILYRSIQEIPPEKWMEKLALEAETDAAEAALGYPLPRRLRPLFSSEHSHSVRVEERVFESYADFGKKMAARNFTPELRLLDDRRRNLVKWEREELFFVDSGMPVPRWMQAVSRKPMTSDEMKEANIVGSPIQVPPERAKANVDAGKLRILYRIVQEVPKDRWAEKLEQERISDAAEKLRGDPLPTRYRAMLGSERSQVRINEREYEDYAAFAKTVESFLADSSPGDKAAMDAEIRRQGFFNWEREEVYIVDSDSFQPKWMTYAAEGGM